MDLDMMNRIEEMLMLIPTKMCRNMDHRFVNVILKDISKDLAKHHFMIMKMLLNEDKLFVTEIVKNLGITKSQMTASVDKLLKLDYVERWADTKDRRKIFISLTNKGKDIAEQIVVKLKKCFHHDMQVLTENELNELERGLIVLNKFCSQNKTMEK